MTGAVRALCEAKGSDPMNETPGLSRAFSFDSVAGQNPQKQYASAFTGAPLPFSRAAFSTKRN